MGKFKELRVWNDAMDLTVKIYEITRQLPFRRDFGLCGQSFCLLEKPYQKPGGSNLLNLLIGFFYLFCRTNLN
ncbi:MAG: four helix bundle protein [Saprospiraceae bacterium]|nr:four helix bundle protein [Saprospiraceae bacterium]